MAVGVVAVLLVRQGLVVLEGQAAGQQLPAVLAAVLPTPTTRALRTAQPPAALAVPASVHRTAAVLVRPA
jgi:hypothetical protein